MFILLQRILPKHLLSRLVGKLANSKVRWIKNSFIRLVILKYKVDLSEARNQDIESYPSFNHFFARELSTGARPIGGTLCSPADGSVSAAGSIQNKMIFQAKGIDYSLEKLLATKDVAAYENGSFMTVYLSPKDYHRVHCPLTGSLSSARYVPGNLFSVNQSTTEGLKDLFADNERLVMEFDTSEGKMAVVMVGALIVAAIQPVWRDMPYRAKTFYKEFFKPAKHFNIGEELGQFQMGSTAIVVLEKNVSWLQKPGNLVKMGEAIVE